MLLTETNLAVGISELNISLKTGKKNGKMKKNYPNTVGIFVDYDVQVSPDASFLEMLDELNNNLELKGEEAVHFESDCREGICGTCGLVINGRPHGPLATIATSQLHMRNFKDGDTLWVEPFRAKAF